MKDRRGFSLLEVLVATSILTVTLSALAALCAMATRANTAAGSTSIATILASEKMEQLRALAWNEVRPTPDGTLVGNIPGSCDFLDTVGRALDGEGTAPPSAVWVRRWSVVPLPEHEAAAVVIQVRVARVGSPHLDAPPGGASPSGEARLIGVRARTVW